MNLRCSRLPLIAACPQAAVAPKVAIETSGDEASIGTATHHLFTSAIAERRDAILHDGWREEVAKFRVDLPEVAMLATASWDLWRKAQPHFPDPSTEEPLVHGILTGHADVLSFHGSEVRILDLKTGRVDSNPEEQLRGYGYLALQNSDAEEVYACQLRPRDREMEGWRWTRTELMEWWERVGASLGRGPYRPGRHCGFCPRWHECEAAIAMTRHALKLVSGQNDLLERTLSGKEALLLYDLRKSIDQASDFIQLILRQNVAQAGGELWDGEDGLVMREMVLKKILFVPGEAVLRERLGERFAEAVKVSKTVAEKIVRDGAGRGMKERAAQALANALEQVGALTVERQERLELKRRRVALPVQK